MEPIRRSSSLPPPEQPNPFWSERIQEDHHLEQRRPKELGGVNEPIPLDDDLDRSPQPSGSSGLVKGEESTSFRTPTAEHAPSEKPQLEEWTEKEMDDSFPPVTNGVSGKVQRGHGDVDVWWVIGSMMGSMGFRQKKWRS